MIPIPGVSTGINLNIPNPRIPNINNPRLPNDIPGISNLQEQHLPPIPNLDQPKPIEKKAPVKCTPRHFYETPTTVIKYVLLQDILQTHGLEWTEKWKQAVGTIECVVVPALDISHNLSENQVGVPYSSYLSIKNPFLWYNTARDTDHWQKRDD